MPPRKPKAEVVDLASDEEEAEAKKKQPAPPSKKKPAAAAAAAPAAAGKRKPAPTKRVDDDAYDSYSDGEEDDEDSDSDGGPARRKPPAKKKSKAKAAASPGGGGGGGGGGGRSPGSSKKPKRHVPRAEPGPEPEGRELEAATGYWLDASLPLMWTCVGADGTVSGAEGDVAVEPRAKVAAFDLDGTLVNVKSSGAMGRAWPLDEDDWVLFNDRVPATVRRYHSDGYEIAILSNQGGVQTKLAGKMAQLVKARSAAVAATLGVPCRVLLCPSRDPDNAYRKPQTGMWAFLEELRGPGAPPIDRARSVFVGDAAGRSGDHGGKAADSDRAFAEALGVPFLTPEEAFGAIKGKAPMTAEAAQAGAAALKAAKQGLGEAEGAGPNAALLAALSGLADKIFALVKDKPGCLPGGDPTKWRFKAQAYQSAARAIAGGFAEKITLANLARVGKVPKVGKSTLEKLRECLESGRIALMAELEGYEAQGAAPAAAVPAHVQQQQAAAAAFM
jgi:bifunctional polynucleotide phosphatase/kinase